MLWNKNLLKTRWMIFLIPFFTLLITLGYYLMPKDQLYSRDFLYFGTMVHVKLITDSSENARQAFAHIESELDRMHRDWHAWQPSLVTQINKACETGESISIPPDLVFLLERGKRYYTLSDGLFNPAAAKIIGAWGFLSDAPNRARKPPAPATINALLQQHPSMDDILIAHHHVKCTNPAVQLDLGGYAKGYAIDFLLDYLSAHGIHNALIDAGGDIGIRGQHFHQPWLIAIKNPFSDKPLKELAVSGSKGIFTSGDYARRFLHENSRYAHIINPKTGQPVESFASVTVIHKDATTADAAATTLMVAGPKNWQEVAKKFELEAVYIVTQDQQILELTH